ncbi:uncharacterized protein LOC143293107 [Babylonia areolata]|uniref:uncharacterized protein LOC143293107 n=1 Tax=Babylonia areolata TaxID=304850 RepID=UPI003FD2CB6F
MVMVMFHPHTCGPNQFRCHSFGQCIQEEWVCDTERDCFDGSDERACAHNCTGGKHQGPRYKVECSAGEVQCDNFRCIEETWLCDGSDDCGTNWDEHNCASSCQSTQFLCSDGSHCIDRRWMCDGHDDCRDQSDETSCVCQVNEFKCNHGKCIPENWKCDGDNDCGDFSDEHACPTIHPTLCGDMMTARDCSLMNDTSHPICLDQEDGFKFCRKFCGLCIHT